MTLRYNFSLDRGLDPFGSVYLYKVVLEDTLNTLCIQDIRVALS